MMKFKVLFFILVSTFLLSCTDEKNQTIYIDSIYNKIINDININEVSDNIDFLTKFSNVIIEYETSNENIVSKDGVVSRTNKNEVVTIYVKFKLNKAIYEKQFDIIVLKKDDDLSKEQYCVWLDSCIKSELSDSIQLPTTNDIYGGSIVWSSSNQDVIKNDGIITRKTIDESVVLTANITYLEESFTREYNVIVLKEEKIHTINDYVSWLESIIPQSTSSNLSLPTTSYAYGGKITWESSNTNIISNTGVISRQEEDCEVKITATINYNDEVTIKDFNIVISKYIDLYTIEDYQEWVTSLIPSYTSENLFLPITHEEFGGSIYWESFTPNNLSNEGQISRQKEDTEAILEATIDFDEKQIHKTFIIVIGKKEMTIDDKYEEVVDDLFMITSLANTTIKDKIDFIYNSVYDSEIEWRTSDESIIGSDSSFSRPDENKVIQITFKVIIDDTEFPEVSFSVTVLGKNNDVNYSSYYKGKVENLNGEALKNALHALISVQTKITYKQWESYRTTDCDPNNKSNVILLYTGESVSFNNHSSYWNREHVWAKSHGNFGEAIGPGSDIHHLRACNNGINSTRGNKDFGEGGNALTNYSYASGSTYSYSTSSSFEPRDEDKGDVARMMFYMATRYEASDGIDLELNDKLNNGSAPYIGKLSYLLKWHIEDPVDDREIARNNAIYAIQKNRNPFIDYPEFVEKIWGTASKMLLFSSSTDKETVYINVMLINAIISNEIIKEKKYGF